MIIKENYNNFIYGVNMPWLDRSDSRNKIFGNDCITGENTTYNHDWVDMAFHNMRAIGIQSVRTWVFTGWNGCIMDEYGFICGISDEFIANLKDFLEVSRKYGVAANLVLVPHQLQCGSSDLTRIMQTIYNPNALNAFIDNAFIPVLETIKEYRDTVNAIDILCEPEADTQEKALINSGTTMGVMGRIMSAEAAAIRKILPDMPIVASGGQNNTNEFYNEIDLDYFGIDVYNDMGEVPSIKGYNTRFPMWITECGAKLLPPFLDDKLSADNFLSFYRNAKAKGYKACFAWHLAADTSLSLTRKRDTSDLRLSAQLLHFDILDDYYSKNGISCEECIDVPSILKGFDNSVLRFIGSRNTKQYKIEYSKNGVDNWAVLDEGFCPETSDNCYLYDYCLPEYIYNEKCFLRITAMGAKGESVPSHPYKAGTSMQKPVLPDSPKKGIEPTVQVECDKPYILSLRSYNWSIADEKHNILPKKIEFNHNSFGIAKQEIFWFDVQKNAEYTLSFELNTPYFSAINSGNFSVGIVDENENPLLMDGKPCAIYPCALDNEWHILGCEFKTANATTLGIVLKGENAKASIKNLMIFETVYAKKYVFGINEAVMHPVKQAELGDKEALTFEEIVTDIKAYNSAKAQGSFIAVENDNMLLVESDTVCATHSRYIKWFSVDKNTNYNVSVTYKCDRANGENTIGIFEKGYNKYYEVVSILLDTTLNEWQNKIITFNSAAKTEAGLFVYDGGSSVKIKKIKVLKAK